MKVMSTEETMQTHVATYTCGEANSQDYPRGYEQPMWNHALLIACRLVAIDKYSGKAPTGVGESLRELIGKVAL